jgi:hypothetical protein
MKEKSGQTPGAYSGPGGEVKPMQFEVLGSRFTVYGSGAEPRSLGWSRGRGLPEI